jgi:hypothetical protein
MDQEIVAAAIFDRVLCHARVTGGEDRMPDSAAVIDFESSDLDATLLVHHPVLIELPRLERHTRKWISMRCQTCA